MALVLRCAILLLVLAYNTTAIQRIYKRGDATLGSLLYVHKSRTAIGCSDFYLPGLNRVEATIRTIHKINNDSELLPNITLGYDIRDYCHDRELTMKETYDFTINSISAVNSFSEYSSSANGVSAECTRCRANHSDYVVAVVGPYGSRNSLQVAGLLQVVGMAGISPSATSEELSWPFYNKFFRTVPPDGLQAKAMADLIDEFKWNYVAAVAVEHSYGLYGIRGLEREALRRKTFCIGFAEYIPPTDYQSQLKEIVRKLKRASKVKVVILWIEDSAAKALMREASRQNVEYRVWILSDSLATKTPDFLGSDFIYLGVYLGIQPRQFRDKNYEEYLKTVTPKESLQHHNLFWEKLWQQEFNCSALLNDSLKGACSENLTINSVVFNKMYDDFIPYHVDAIYAVAHALDKIYRCTEPHGLLANGKCPPTARILPEHVLLYLKNVSFEGLTGLVQFDDNGDPLSSSYDVISFQKDPSPSNHAITYSKVKVGSWNRNRERRLQILNDSIDWKFPSPPQSVCKESCQPGTMQTETIACCWECIQCSEGSITSVIAATNCTSCPATQRPNKKRTACVDLPIVALEWYDPTSVMFCIAINVGLIFCGFVFFVFLRHQRTPVVKASNKELCFLILFAIACNLTLAFVILARPSDSICSTIEPSRYVTLTICVSVLFLKTMRLLRAFETRPVFQCLNDQWILSTRRQFYAIALINAPQNLLAVLWVIFDPPLLKMDIISKEKIILTCVLNKTQAGMVLHICMVVYLVIWSLACTWYAFKARNLPENFNEAKYIGFSMYILLLSWMTYFPVRSTLEGTYVSVVSCATVLVSSYGLLLCIFAPKLYVILRHPEKNTTHFVRAEMRTQISNRVEPVTRVEKT